jgi:hypothetical protein
MKEFDAFLDSLTRPKSFFTLSTTAGNGLLAFQDKETLEYSINRKIIMSSQLEYFHKSGLGISMRSNMLPEKGRLNVYQFAITPSYDFFRSRNFSAGLAYSRYFTKDSLSFYSTPIQNELFAYAQYKSWWLKPGLALSYGWGSRTEYESLQTGLNLKRARYAREKGEVYIENNESVKDLSMMLSVRHDFEWGKIFTGSDMIRFTPLLLLSASTQTFGFNTSFSSDATMTSNRFLSFSQKTTAVNRFDIQAASLVIRLDYMIGKFYFQPQVFSDYYLHTSTGHRLNHFVSATAGYIF